MTAHFRANIRKIALVISVTLGVVLVACGTDAPTAAPPLATKPGLTQTTVPVTSPTLASTIATNGSAAVATNSVIASSSTPSPATTASTVPATTVRPNILMKDFIGVNSDYKLREDGTVKDFARISKWVRDYANWYCLQPQENSYGGVDGTAGCGTSPSFFNYNAFYTDLQNAGVNVLHNSLYTPGFANWTGKNGDFPPVQTEGQGQKPNDFLKHAQFLYQIAALYGNNKNVASNTLALPGQKTGQNFIHAIENWNEPDGWWKGKGQFTKEQLYNMLLADYDGDNGRLPKAGVKQADPNLKFVMAGLATTDLSYLYGIMAYVNQQGRKFPADVLNFHEYASDGKKGITPEAANFGENMLKASKWRDTNAPGAEIWMTEFGWDTFAKGNEFSRSYAGEQNQANWILRALVLYRAAGVDKAFAFIYNDDQIGSTEVYYSSGLVTLKNDKKPAYYYLGTMQDMLGEMYLDQPLATGQPEVRAYTFRNPTGQNGVFTVWKTSGDGSKIDNFSLQLPQGTSQNCTAVVPSKNNFNPGRTPLTVGADGKVKLTVSETMTFIACDKVGQRSAAQMPGNSTGPTVGANNRLDLSAANIFESGPVASDPASKILVSDLLDEQKIGPDDAQAIPPKTSWLALTPQSSFALDLTRGFDLGRLDWFNAGGNDSGFDVFAAPPGGYGKWQPLTSIANKGEFYGKWMSVQLTNTTNIQYLQFVPKSNGFDAKLGEIALYTQGAKPLVQPAPAVQGQGSVSAAAATAIPFSPIGIPTPTTGPVLAPALPAQGRLAIVGAAAQGGNDIKVLFDGNKDTDWRVPNKPEYAQFSLALDGVHSLELIRYFVSGTNHAPNTKIEYSSDGQTWQTVNGAAAIDAGKTYGWNELKADGIKARYLRFILKNLPDGTGDKFFELGYFGEIQIIGN